ncbi:MAG: hypothetical protein H7832_04755 [Magnetococcus sp. DMHC-6]
MMVLLWPSVFSLMQRLIWVQIFLAVGAAFGMGIHFMRHAGGVAGRGSWWPLLHFAKPSLVIGLLSPLSALLMRRLLAEGLSWREVGMIQAQWRVTDWVMALASGVMAIRYLPLLSAELSTATFFRLLRQMALVTLLPGAFFLLGYLWFQNSLLVFFYQVDFALSTRAAALFLLGDWVRIISWIFLYALFARRQTWAIAVGEFLSIPLFVTLVWLSPSPMNPVFVAELWLVSYCVYAIFNGFMVMRSSP